MAENDAMRCMLRGYVHCLAKYIHEHAKGDPFFTFMNWLLCNSFGSFFEDEMIVMEVNLRYNLMFSTFSIPARYEKKSGKRKHCINEVLVCAIYRSFSKWHRNTKLSRSFVKPECIPLPFLFNNLALLKIFSFR